MKLTKEELDTLAMQLTENPTLETLEQFVSTLRKNNPTNSVSQGPTLNFDGNIFSSNPPDLMSPPENLQNSPSALANKQPFFGQDTFGNTPSSNAPGNVIPISGQPTNLNPQQTILGGMQELNRNTGYPNQAA